MLEVNFDACIVYAVRGDSSSAEIRSELGTINAIAKGDGSAILVVSIKFRARSITMREPPQLAHYSRSSTHVERGSPRFVSSANLDEKYGFCFRTA